MAMDRPTGAGKDRAAPAAAYAARELPPPAALGKDPGPGASPSLVPDTGCGIGLIIKKSPAGLRSGVN